MYDIRLHRISVMSKMTMIGLIHNRCLTIKYGAFDDAAAVTLISTDVEEVMFSADIFHEIWAQCLELCIGLYFLARELGWVCIVPLLVVACKLFSSLIALSLSHEPYMTRCSHFARMQICNCRYSYPPESSQHGYAGSHLKNQSSTRIHEEYQDDGSSQHNGRQGAGCSRL